MSYEKRIHDYLAGELSPEEERRLFDDLSAHPEWRHELTAQLKIEQAAQKDLGTVVVPTAVTAAIFSSLDFAAPDQSIASPVKTMTGVTGTTILSRFGLFAMVSTVSAIIAVGCLVFMLYRSSETTPIVHSASAPNVYSSVHDSVQTHSSTSEPNQVVKAATSSPAATKEMTALKTPFIKTIPNEPMRFYFDIGRFSSVDYLTQKKIIGVADEGKIYCSEDGGKSWEMQTSGTSSDLYGVHFIDTTHGIAVGAKGTVLHTSTAGREWQKMSSGTEATLATVRYANRDTVYACGAQGTIIRSTSSGIQWQQLESGTTANLFKIRFENGSTGIVGGEHNLTLETDNAGTTWHVKPQ